MERHYSSQRGFSFTELMISLFFLNAVALLSLGVVSMMLRSSQKLVDYSSGTVVADQVMENYIYNHSSFAPAVISGEVSSEFRNFEYKIDVITVVPYLHKIDVKVFWWNSDADYRAGYGKMFTSLTTMVRESEASATK